MYVLPVPRRRSLAAVIGLMVVTELLAAVQQATKPHRVTIGEEKDEVVERFLPIDSVIRAGCEYRGNMAMTVLLEGKVEGKPLSSAGGSEALFMIDGVVRAPRTTNRLFNLPDGPNQKKRYGGHSFWVYDDIRVNVTIELVPGKPSLIEPGSPVPRRMDTLLCRYSIHNTGDIAHRVGCRIYNEIQLLDNAGALFASPTTHPNRVLDGVLLKGHQVPSFLEILENPNVQKPGSTSIFTFKATNKMERPDKVVLTSRGAQGPWEVRVAPSIGQSACAFFWEAKEIAPQGKREIGFAYGKGIACRPEHEGRVPIDFGGSFEPGKTFTVTAYVEDPIDGQSLTLRLPKGIECIAGNTTQSVPPPDERSRSVVLWRCRLLQVGAYPIRVRSSHGVTQTRIVTVTPPD